MPGIGESRLVAGTGKIDFPAPRITSGGASVDGSSASIQTDSVLAKKVEALEATITLLSSQLLALTSRVSNIEEA